MLVAKKRAQGQQHIELTAYILWQIWKSGNSGMFEHKGKDGKEVIQRVTMEWNEFELASKEGKEVSKMETGAETQIEVANQY